MRKIVLLSVTIMLFAPILLTGQDNFDINNLSKINVENLTDAQVVRYMEKAEASGYSQDQLLLLAKAKGMSSSQLNQLQERIEGLRKKGLGNSTPVEDDSNRIRSYSLNQSNPISRTDPFSSLTSGDSIRIQHEDLEVFGRRYFTGEIPIFQPSLNGPTPENYILGPGDEILIDIWGAFEYSYRLLVSPEGYIRIPDIGPIQLAGLQFDKASQRIKLRLRKIYSSLGDNAFADISLGGIKSINVHVVGEVVKPGTYTTHSFATVLNLLYLAGGPSKDGSLREIDVYRNGIRLNTIDGYQFLLEGASTSQRLSDGDVILIKSYSNHIAIKGEVKRPAIYELKNEENLSDLLKFAGGFTGEAFRDVISLRRISNGFNAVSTITEDGYSEFLLKDADQVEVKRAANYFVNRVTIQGAIFQPGEFELTDSLSLSKLIELAGGLRGDALLGRAVIYSKNKDYSLSSKSINLSELTYTNGESEIQLRKEDFVIIESVNQIRERTFVQIEGEVIKPGVYPFVEGQTIEELVLLAGGFKETALKSKAEVARRLIKSEGNGSSGLISKLFEIDINSDLEYDNDASTFVFEPYDLVSIRKNPFYKKQAKVEISGEVTFPGVYVLEKKGERISDIIKRANGFTNFAFLKGATLIRKTEYYSSGDDSGEKQAAKVKREELLSIFRRDTIASSEEKTLKEREIVGIELEKIMNSPGSDFDLILKEDDILYIPAQLQTVRVRGSVLHPGNVRYAKNLSFRKFISQAGGFKDEARVKKSYVIYANGTASSTKSFLWFKNYPKIEPGAEIIIPTKPERRRLTPQEVIGMTTGLASLALLISRF
ncbi:MAG: SLBB domain-containing protein [Cyclobacteriaceae bacterium]